MSVVNQDDNIFNSAALHFMNGQTIPKFNFIEFTPLICDYLPTKICFKQFVGLTVRTILSIYSLSNYGLSEIYLYAFANYSCFISPYFSFNYYFIYFFNFSYLFSYHFTSFSSSFNNFGNPLLISPFSMIFNRSLYII